MGRLSLWVLLGLTMFALSLQDVQVSADVGPSESECRPYIEKAIHELKTGEPTEPDESGGDSQEHETSAEDTGGEVASGEQAAEGESAENDTGEADDDDDTTEDAVVETVEDTVEEADDDTDEKDDDEKEPEQADQADHDDDDDDDEQKTEEDNGKSEEAKEDTDEDEDEADDTKSGEDETGEKVDEDGKSEEDKDDDQDDATASEETEDATKSGEDDDEGTEEAEGQDDDDEEGTSQEDESKTATPDEESGETQDNQPAESVEDKDDDENDGDDDEEKDVEGKSEEEAASEEAEASKEETEAADDDKDDDEDEEKSKEQSADEDDEDDEHDNKTEEDKDDDDEKDEQEEELKSRGKRSIADDDNDDEPSKEKEDADDDKESGEDVEVDGAKDEKDEGDSQEGDDDDEKDEGDGKDGDDEEGSEDDEKSEEESQPEDDLLLEVDIPENLRDRKHIDELLHLDDEFEEKEQAIDRVAEIILRDLKRIYENAVKPLETLYKYRDLSNRHFSDPEIFSKPLILFMGPWSGGKSTIINYLTDNEHTLHSLRSGAEPSPAYFNIVMHGNETEVLDGTQLAADWTFSGLQKFGQGLEDRLRGLKLPNKLLEKVNIVEIPGILEVRKQVSRLFPFNDACQWFIDRADIIFLVYDPAKLDVGPETEAILDQLKGREYQTRIILNKADTVKPEELLRVQSALIWNISPLMSSAQPPVMYTASLWSHPYETSSPIRLLQAQERAFLRDIRGAIDKRIENKIASARRFAVRVRNHAKMVDCYLTTYYNHKTLFGNKKRISDQIIENPQNYHIYEGLSTLTNISRYDLPDPEVYRDFFRLNPLYEFKKLSETCTYFRGCPINKLDVAIAYDLPELVGKYKKMSDSALTAIDSDDKSKS